VTWVSGITLGVLGKSVAKCVVVAEARSLAGLVVDDHDASFEFDEVLTFVVALDAASAVEHHFSLHALLLVEAVGV